jgi:acyl-CoA synthetase (NDP forming)
MPGSSSTDLASARAALARALFSPERIALVGASPQPSKLAARPQRVLRRHGFRGSIVPIHPVHREIGGDRAYARVSEVPGGIDHAFVMVAATAVPAAIADCAAAGVKVATIFTSGFGESGDEGKRRQDAMLTAARASGLRLLGPNCLGIVNVGGGVVISANAVLEHEALRRGGLSVISQSGSMLGAIVTRAQERGLGFSKLVSVGNECDLAVGELVHLLVDDAATEVILLFLEAFRDATVLAEAARRAFAAGKPIIALKPGRSAAGRDIAATHTGALAGSDQAADAFFLAHGILRVNVFEAMFEAAPFVRGRRPPKGRRVAALTVSGGAAAMVVDRLGLAGIELVAPPADIVRRLAVKRIRIPAAPLTDLPMGRADGGAYAAILAELLASDHCDVVLAVQGSAATYTPDVVQERVLAAEPGAKPLAVFVGPRAHEALQRLQAAGVAGFRTPESCADAIRAYCDWRAPAEPLAVDPGQVAAVQASVQASPRGVLNERDAARILACLDLPVVPSRVVQTGREPLDLPYPLVAKILSRDLPHKSEIGAVTLAIADASALARAVDTILTRVRAAAPAARIDGVLVQPLQRGLGEVIVGFRHDREVGPIVMVGPGGILAELWGSHAVRLAPVSVETAAEMIAAVPGLAPIRGYRNRPAGDLAALARAIHRLSLLALLTDPLVVEAEINPLIVRTDGVIAVDALLRIAQVGANTGRMG